MSDLGNRTNVNAAIDLLLDDAQPNEAIQPSDHNGLLKDILDTLANGLSVTLRTGNTTSGQNIEVTSGDAIDFDNSSFLGSLTSGTLTAARTYTLPDKTGTVAMLSDVENILNTNGLILGGNYTHDLNSNNLGMFGGSFAIGDDLSVISSDATKTYLANFVSSSSNAVLTLRNIVENVGIGNNLPDSSAKLEISSTDSGLLIPRMSTTQRNAIGSPLESLMIYNTTDDQFEYYDSLGAWSQLGGGGASIYTLDGTIGTGRVATLTDTLSFEGGTVNIQGAGTTTGTTLALYDNDTIPNLNWEWLDNGNVNVNQAVEVNTSNTFNFKNGSREVGIASWNTHAYWGINNGTRRWDLISANSSSAFNADEFGIANGSSIPIRIFNNTSVALGNVNKVNLNTAYSVQTAGDTLVGGDLYATDGTNTVELDFNNYPKLKISAPSNEWWMIEGDGTGSVFDNGDLYIYDSTNARKMLQFKANGTINAPNLPTSSAGLVAGDIWNDGGTLKIV